MKNNNQKGIMIVHGSDTDGNTYNMVIKNVTELDSEEAWNEQFLYSPEGWYNYSWFPNWEAVPEKYKKGGENEEENKTDSPS